MKKFIPFLISVISCNLSYSQYDFLFEKQEINKIREHEKSINSECLGFIKTKVANDYFPSAKENHDYYPLVYNRKNDSFYPQLETSYFYNENDSTLIASEYNWNVMKYVKNLKTDSDKFEAEIKREKEYLTKYNEIKENIISKYGKPTTIEENLEGGHFYRLKWKNKDNEILVLLKFSKKLTSLPGNMKIGSYGIRVKIDYIN